jgi:hypothetical protein
VCFLVALALMLPVSKDMGPGTCRSDGTQGIGLALILTQGSHQPAIAASGEAVRANGRVSAASKVFAGIGSFAGLSLGCCDFLSLARSHARVQARSLDSESGRSPPVPSIVSL